MRVCASGIGNWDQPRHTTCGRRRLAKNPTYSAFWSVFGVTCLRLQRLASSVGFGRTARLAPRKNQPDSGVSSEPGGCYTTLARPSAIFWRFLSPSISARLSFASFDETTTRASGVALCRRNPDRAAVIPVPPLLLLAGSLSLAVLTLAWPRARLVGLCALIVADRLDQSHAPHRHPFPARPAPHPRRAA